VANLELVRGRNGRSTGTCYVTYAHHADAEKAMHEYQGHIAVGRRITLTIVSPKVLNSVSNGSKVLLTGETNVSSAQENNIPTHNSAGDEKSNVTSAQENNIPTHNSAGDEKSNVTSNLHTQEPNNIITRKPMMPRDHNISIMQQEDVEMSDFLEAFFNLEETPLPALDKDVEYDLML
jgi:RNA recognition motif-containing protein